MRFVTLVIALAGAVAAVQDVDANPGLIAPVQIRATAKAATATACSSKKRFMRRGTMCGWDQDTDSWIVDMNEYCQADMVDPNHKVVITDISGCSAVFFFGSDGKPTAYHIEAGKEAVEGKNAAAIALEQKSTSSCFIWAMDQAKVKDVQAALKAAKYPTVCGSKTYALDTKDRKSRWKFEVTVPSTTITPSKYTCA